MSLPWIRLDTNLPTNAKILALAGLGDKGLASAFVYIASIAHSGGHGTDGFIAKAALPFVHGKPTHARMLVEARLWTPVDGGWQIVNYGERNLVGASAQALSEVRSAAGRRGAEARWGSKAAD